MTKDELQDKLYAHTEAMDSLIQSMPDKGLKCIDSQKLCLLISLHKLQMNIIGIEEEDLLQDGSV